MNPTRISPVPKLSLTAALALGLTTMVAGSLPPTPLAAQDALQVQALRGYPLGAGDVLRLGFLNRPDIRLNIPVELTGLRQFPVHRLGAGRWPHDRGAARGAAAAA